MNQGTLDLDSPQSTPTYRLFIDGACRGNPGPAAYGCILYKGQEMLLKEKGYIGKGTNNLAEYTALIKGLEAAWKVGVREELEIFSDSQLLVRQIIGLYKVKNPRLQRLFQEAQTLLKRFKRVHIFHIDRGLNREADRLANRALDEVLKKTGQSPAGSGLREESPGPTGQGAG